MSEKKITFGRVFWPSLWAGLIVSLLIGIIWIIFIGTLFSGFSSEPASVQDKTVLHLTLEGEIGERGESKLNPMSFSFDKKIGLSALLHGFNKAAKDKKIKGIFLELNNPICGIATAKEIRDAINRFEESGKFVIAYNSGEVVTTKSYYIASAANENYGFPSSNVQFLGLGAELSFFKKTLDNLEVEMQVIRGSDNHFKSAVEPFFRENMSDSARLQTERYIGGIWEEIRKDIGKDRSISIEKLNELAEKASILDVNDAVKHKLMDGAFYKDEVMTLLKKKCKIAAKNEIEFFAFEKYAKKAFYQDQILMVEDNPNIAVILAEGGVAKSGEGLTSDDICKLFQEVRANKSIKTVVFRVNSPGGSALASDEIWREVKLTNQKKKVIVSMGDVAASGGYYISAPATTIFAQPSTITGSIGVFGVIPFTGKMLENKLGLTFDRVATNKHAIMTTNRKLTEEELSIIQKNVDNIYDQFKGVVAEGRGMTKAQVNVVGRGRVWTGADAHKIGLVDELGGLYDAINFAAKKSNIKTQKVLYYPIAKEDKFSAIIEQLEDTEASIKVQKGMTMPKELQVYYNQLKKLEAIQGIQMRLPFDVNFN